MLSKIFKIILVSIVLLLSVGIPASIYFVRLRNDSFLGRILKEKVIKYPKLVRLMDLNEPGDYKFFYLGLGNEALRVKVVTLNDKYSDKDAKNWFTEILQKTVNKKAVFSDKSVSYPKTELLENEDLNKIRDEIISDAETDLNLVYAGSYAVEPSSVGVVIHRDTIFIFADAIEALSEKGYINNLLEKTTIMHEWGHLLSLEHFNKENCIMNELLEVYDRPPTGKTIPAVYCWEELNQLRKIKEAI